MKRNAESCASRHRRADVSGKRGHDVDLKSLRAQDIAVAGERRCDPCFRVVEEIEIVTVARGVRRDVYRRTTGEIPLRHTRLRQDREDRLLEVG